MVRLSVVVTVYNLEKQISFCLDSLLCQSLNDEEYEIIIVNDCSTDNSLKILKRYEKENKNIKLISSKENNGLGASWNIGYQNATGKWVHFVDGDDFIKHNAYRNLLNYADKADADMVLFGYWSTAYRDYKHGSLSVPIDGGLAGEIDSWSKRIALANINTTLWTKIYNKSFLDRMQKDGIIFPSILNADGAMHLEFVCNCKKFDIYSEPIYYYWQHVRNRSKDSQIRYIEEYLCAVELAKMHDYYNSIKDLLIKNAVDGYASFIKRQFGYMRFNDMWEINNRMYDKMKELDANFDSTWMKKYKDIAAIVKCVEHGNKSGFLYEYIRGNILFSMRNRLKYSPNFRKIYDSLRIFGKINKKINGVSEYRYLGYGEEDIINE